MLKRRKGWRAAAVYSGLILLAAFEFAVFPGHTYLRGASQPYVAALERLKAPGYLSNDLVAAHPDFAPTAYDELTLLASDTLRVDLREVLLSGQFLARVAGIFGIFLLAEAAGAGTLPAMVLAALLSLGTFAPGPDIWLFAPEATPRGIAFGLVLLAAGLLARHRYVPAGLAGGCALLFAPVFAGPFWLTVIAAFLFDRELRRLLRPLAPILIVFILLIANLAQLQQGIPVAQPFFSRINDATAAILQFRSPSLWLAFWPGKDIFLYLALLVGAIWALTRLWTSLNRPTRWVLFLIPLQSLLTIPLCALLMDRLHWAAALRFAPLTMLGYLVIFTWILWGIAAARAIQRRSLREAVIWTAISFCMFALSIGQQYRKPAGPDTLPLAHWAVSGTWGSSTFFFADSRRASYPGRFRAQSLRPVWSDWEGGSVIERDPTIAQEWMKRWRYATQPLTSTNLNNWLSLPVDYIVLGRTSLLETVTGDETSVVKPVYEDANFTAYETSTLRILPGKLIVAAK